MDTQGTETVLSQRWEVLGLLVAGFGGRAHNTFEGFAFASGEMAMTLVPTVILMVLWSVAPGRILWWVTLVWVLLDLIVGAVLSILLLPIWTFEPDQSAGHYTSHILYGVTQLPALHAPWLTRPAQVVA